MWPGYKNDDNGLLSSLNYSFGIIGGVVSAASTEPAFAPLIASAKSFCLHLCRRAPTDLLKVALSSEKKKPKQ